LLLCRTHAVFSVNSSSRSESNIQLIQTAQRAWSGIVHLEVSTHPSQENSSCTRD
jgi:hypothetical protein